MVATILKKQGMTTDESKLAMASGFVTLAHAIQQLLSDKGYLKELGEAAAEANALNDREIDARNEAADIVFRSAGVTAAHDEREKALVKLSNDVEAQKTAAQQEVESLANQRKAEIDELHRQANERHAHAVKVEEAAQAKHSEASVVLSDAKRQKDLLDAREQDLERREGEIEKFKNKLVG